MYLLLALVAVIFRLCNDYVGGKYILIILMRVLFGNNNFTNIPYSLLCVFSIYNGLRTYIAKPPRVLPVRRDSTSR